MAWNISWAISLFITLDLKRGEEKNPPKKTMTGQWHEFRPVSISAISWNCFFFMHTLKRIPRLDFPNLIRNWWRLLSYGGAEQRDEAFHHLSLPVILLPLTWSPELAKANYLGQTISISKHSQQIAFHYWHARQARKLPSTHRDRQSTNGQILIPTCPDATIAAVNERHRACDLSCTERAKSGKVISNDIPCLHTRLPYPRHYCATFLQPVRLRQRLQVKQS